MNCLYYPTSLSYITSRRPPSLGEALGQECSPDSLVKYHQDSGPELFFEFNSEEVFRLSLKKPLSPLNFHFPVLGDGEFMSATIRKSSISLKSLDTRNTSLIATFSILTSKKSFTTNDTDFEDLYDVSSDEELTEEKYSCQKVKAHKNLESFQTPLLSYSEIDRPVTSSVSKPTKNAADITKESVVEPILSTENQNTTQIFSYQKVRPRIKPLCLESPSLDGSLSSDQMTRFSVPSTPDSDNSGETGIEKWHGGVQLQPDAMATLQAISGSHVWEVESFEKSWDLTPSVSVIPEMQQVRLQIPTNLCQDSPFEIPFNKLDSPNHIASLDIPSPMRFISMGLSPGTRHTWHFDLPSSTTAEHFYRTPFVTSVKDDEVDTPSGAPPTEISPLTSPQLQRPELNSGNYSYHSPVGDNKPFKNEKIGSLKRYSSYTKSHIIEKNFDRTSFWVAIQRSILSRPSSPAGKLDDGETNFDCMIDKDTLKNVRQSLGIEHLETVHYRAFQYLISNSSNQDTYIHRIPRYEAIQSQRVSFPEIHRAQILGNYQLNDSPLGAKDQFLSYLSSCKELKIDELRKLGRDLEDEAVQQILLTTWTHMAIKFLNHGHLLATPIANHLRTMRYNDDGSQFDQPCILDLGGQEIGGWGWHCANEYPESLVYTVNPKSLQHTASKISGPGNHYNIGVDSFTRLPFEDEKFDLISAHSLYTILKLYNENGHDEWDACLEECFRVLKPGGYLEFELMDSSITNAGPLGLAKGLEFTTSLKLLGYDPQPTSCWLARLERSRFRAVRRTWLFLPMGGSANNYSIEKDGTKSTSRAKTEMLNSASTTDIAYICGIVGSWAWERWLLRFRLLTGGLDENSEGIGAIMIEGRKCNAGWRYLTGWARKPYNNR